jgi:hypothetical protein
MRVGYGVTLLIRHSSTTTPYTAQVQPRLLALKKQDESDPNDGRSRVAIFFGMQTGTIEGFVKVPPTAALPSPSFLLRPKLSA